MNGTNKLLLICLFFAQMSLAQTVEEIKADEERYVWGQGTGATQKEAKENALHDLSSNISTHVSSADKIYMSNEQKSKDVSTYVSFDSKMSTYSTVTLNGCHTKIIQSGKPYVVFAYIENIMVDKMFEDRLRIMRANVQTANEAFRDLNLADALRYYYTSYLLTQSLRYRADATVEDENGKEQVAMVWIRKRIEDILSNVKVTVVGRNNNDDNTYILGFFYKNKPVQKIGYTYWDGDDTKEQISYAQDGQGLVELEPSFSVNNVKVMIEYKYEKLVNRNNAELSAIYEALADDVSFNGTCGTSVKQSNIGDTQAVYEGQLVSSKMSNTQSSAIKALGRVRPENKPLSQEQGLPFAQTLNSVVEFIKARHYSSVKDKCTEDGYKAFCQLIEYGKARIVGDPSVTFTEYNGHVYGRSVPMEFSFKGGEKFRENVVFMFTQDGKIDNVSFGLGYKAETDLFCNMAEEQYASVRSAISNFLESYKTAYALGRFDYLDMVFSDDALIVTGKEIKKMVGDSEHGFHMEKKVVKTRQSKDQYLANLKAAFDSKEYVNIQFVNNYIQPSRRSIQNGRDVYGIQIRQDYFSNNYKDQGYLFLRVDVTDPDAPIVSVRVWQELPDEKDGVANISNWQNFFEEYDK